MQPQTLRYLNLSATTMINAFAQRATLQPILERVLKLRPEVNISYDNAPVFQSPQTYQASYEHHTKKLTLNQVFIDKAPEPALVEAFLIAHELFHAAEGKAVTKQMEAAHEERADQIALLAVFEEFGLPPALGMSLHDKSTQHV